jgi:hypothetical protein
MRIAGLAGLVGITALLTSVGPAGASWTCQPGHTPPDTTYCEKVLPIGSTESANHVGRHSAELHGIAGSAVSGPNAYPDQTHFFWRYGRTTSYGTRTATRTLAPNQTAAYLSRTIRGLRAGTVYHFRLVAYDAEGKTIGDDLSFKTHG